MATNKKAPKYQDRIRSKAQSTIEENAKKEFRKLLVEMSKELGTETSKIINKK